MGLNKEPEIRCVIEKIIQKILAYLKGYTTEE